MEASVLVMKCGLSRNTFGVRIQKMRDGDWYRTWAFKLNDKLAKREGYELQSISGSLIATEDFPGCPYCGAHSFYQCGNCNKIVYWDTKDTSLTCPWCNNSCDTMVQVEQFSVDGNEF